MGHPRVHRGEATLLNHINPGHQTNVGGRSIDRKVGAVMEVALPSDVAEGEAENRNLIEITKNNEIIIII